MRFTYYQVEWETDGEYRIPKPDDWFISDKGEMIHAIICSYSEPRLIVRRVKRRFECNGITFEETGEIRHVRKGDWYLYNPSGDWYFGGRPGIVYPIIDDNLIKSQEIIVKPVAIKE